jgi:Fe-Mn family superoxide dismutase
MTIHVKPLLFKPHRLNGLSDKLLISHYENNYGGALRRLNAILAKLAMLDWPSAPVFEINGMKREELVAAGSVIRTRSTSTLSAARAATHREDSAWLRRWNAASAAFVPGMPSSQPRQRRRPADRAGPY